MDLPSNQFGSFGHVYKVNDWAWGKDNDAFLTEGYP